MNNKDKQMIGERLATLLSDMGINELSDMQRNAFTSISKGGNVRLHSPTGSGKTLAFLLPLVKSLTQDSATGSIVIVEPSRELALQVGEVVKQLDKAIRVQTFYGGRPVKPEMLSFEGKQPQIIIGTPGRICDHLHHRTFQGIRPHTIVVDEYDKCLQMGFEAEMSELAERLSPERYVITSATASKLLPTWAGFSDRELETIQAKSQDDPSVSCFVAEFASEHLKDDLLKLLLLNYSSRKTIVFVNERDSVERVVAVLKEGGFSCVGYQGTMEQDERERMLFRFKTGCAAILVATDLAARGLDIDSVELAVHYDAPLAESIYKHRIGRTSRWQSGGTSIIMLLRGEVLKFEGGENLNISELKAKTFHPLVPDKTTAYIGKGKKNKVSKGDVLGVLCKDKGLPSSSVGEIMIAENYSLAAIERKAAEKFLEGKDPTVRVKGVKTHLQLLF